MPDEKTKVRFIDILLEMLTDEDAVENFDRLLSLSSKVSLGMYETVPKEMEENYRGEILAFAFLPYLLDVIHEKLKPGTKAAILEALRKDVDEMAAKVSG